DGAELDIATYDHRRSAHYVDEMCHRELCARCIELRIAMDDGDRLMALCAQPGRHGDARGECRLELAHAEVDGAPEAVRIGQSVERAVGAFDAERVDRADDDDTGRIPWTAHVGAEVVLPILARTARHGAHRRLPALCVGARRCVYAAHA